MVYVPAGEFIMGSDEGEMDEKPQRTVWLDSYYIDKYEVTWKQWRMGEDLPQLRDIDGGPIVKFKPVWGRGDHLPVSYVKWTDARAYADWVGKRLPTEAEWEKAARGTDGRMYPWGNEEPDIERAVWQEHPIGKDEPAPVRCCEAGASPYGVVNMVGNIFEWCEDWYGRAYYRTAPDKNPVNRERPKEEPYRVLRGGAFTLAKEDLRITLRNRQWPEEGQDYVGFRLVLPAAGGGDDAGSP